MLAVPICLLFLAYTPMPLVEGGLDAPDARPAQVQTLADVPDAPEPTATLAEAVAAEASAPPAATAAPAPTDVPAETAATPPPVVPETPTAEASLTPEATQAPTTEALQTVGNPTDPADPKSGPLAATGVDAQAMQAAQAEGSLSGGDIGLHDFTAVVLDGTSQRTTAVWSIGDVVDSTGTGNGWNVSLTLTQFKESTGTGYVLLGDSLQTASLTVVVKPTVTGLDDQTTPAEQIAVVAVTTALDTGTPVTLLASGNGQGMGSYSISSFTVRLTVPADAYAHTYRTSATIASIASP